MVHGMNNDDLRETAWSLATLMVAGLAIFLLLLWVSTAPAKDRPEVCLSKKEARQLWPRQHIYWYSKDHCWSNRRGPPRNLKFDPVFSKAHAQEVMPDPKRPTDDHKNRPGSGGSRAVIKIVKWGDYNELDAAADADLFFNAQPVPFWKFSALDDGFDTWRRRVDDLLK